MKLFEKLFRPRPPIRDREALADFIDAQSAFIVQKGIYEYSRARAGHYAKVLFAEKEFARSRRARPLASLSAGPFDGGRNGRRGVGVSGRNAAPGNARPADTPSSFRCSIAIPFRHRSAKRHGWLARSDLAHRLDLVGGHARKRVMDIPEPLAEAYFAMMPIHEKLRGRDFQTTRNYLRVSLCNIHDELISRMDRAACERALTTGAAA